MNKKELWKNFNLGTELDISASFIYNGLDSFNKMKNFYYEDEIFDFLYNISVGIERLLKIVIQLNDNSFNIKTHNHEKLLEEVKLRYKIKFEKKHNQFIKILNNFYKKYRYNRFDFSFDNEYNKEKEELISFINKNTTVTIKNVFNKEITRNNANLKIYIGNTVGYIVNNLYSIIENESFKQNIFIYEFRSYSKSYKIFCLKEFNFLNDRVKKLELFLFVLANKNKSEILNLMDTLELDDSEIDRYVSLLMDENFSLKNDEIFLEDSNLTKRKEKIKNLIEILENQYGK